MISWIFFDQYSETMVNVDSRVTLVTMTINHSKKEKGQTGDQNKHPLSVLKSCMLINLLGLDKIVLEHEVASYTKCDRSMQFKTLTKKL